MEILCERGAAQRAACGEARLVGGHAAAAVRVLEEREMRSNFTRRLGVGAFAAKDIQEPTQEPPHVTTR
jgi:hypothetical protein